MVPKATITGLLLGPRCINKTQDGMHTGHYCCHH